MKILRARLYEVKRAEKDRERVKERREQIGSGGRQERIRTYNYNQVCNTGNGPVRPVVPYTGQGDRPQGGRDPVWGAGVPTGWAPIGTPHRTIEATPTDRIFD